MYKLILKPDFLNIIIFRLIYLQSNIYKTRYNI